MVSDSELLKLLHNKPELGLEIMMDSYMPLIYTLVFNNLLIRYSKEDVEECINDVFFKVFNYKNRFDSQNSFSEVLSTIIEKRKIMDRYRKNSNNNQIPINHVVSSVLLKECNSQLIDATKFLGEADSEIITRKYYLNQRLNDISKNTGLKINTYV